MFAVLSEGAAPSLSTESGELHLAQSHAPGAATRARKHLLRQRLFWVRLRTMLRNRTHAILDRQRGLERPQLKDLFGKRGQTWLQNVQLPTASDQPLLAQDLEVTRLLAAKIQRARRTYRRQPERGGKAARESARHRSGV